MAASDNSNLQEKKEWVNPEIISENLESTKGGAWTSFSPGDDTWYAS